jgi:hypothetical protein
VNAQLVLLFLPQAGPSIAELDECVPMRVAVGFFEKVEAPHPIGHPVNPVPADELPVHSAVPFPQDAEPDIIRRAARLSPGQAGVVRCKCDEGVEIECVEPR